MVKGENREPKYGKHIGQKQELIPALVSMRKTKNTKYVNHLGDTIRISVSQTEIWTTCPLEDLPHQPQWEAICFLSDSQAALKAVVCYTLQTTRPVFWQDATT